MGWDCCWPSSPSLYSLSPLHHTASMKTRYFLSSEKIKNNMAMLMRFKNKTVTQIYFRVAAYFSLILFSQGFFQPVYKYVCNVLPLPGSLSLSLVCARVCVYNICVYVNDIYIYMYIYIYACVHMLHCY